MLLRSGMVERTSGTDALALQMPTGRAARIRDIYMYNAAAGAEAISVTIDRKTIMELAVPSSWWLLGSQRVGGYTSIRDVIRDAGLWPVIPLGEGETLGITGPGVDDYIEVVYDLYNAADVSPSEPNGSKSSVYRMFQVVSNAGVRATAGDLDLDQSDLSSRFPAFPGGALVPARTAMSLVGLFGAAATKGTGAANGEYTTYLKMLADREDILDLDLGGVTFLGDVSYTTADVKYETIAGRIQAGVQHAIPQIMVFDPPIEFPAGSELNVLATLARTGVGGDFVAGEVKLGMIFDVAKVG